MQKALILAVFLAVTVPPLPPNVPLAVAVNDPFGYRVIASENGTAIMTAFGSPLRLRVAANGSVNVEVVLATGSEAISKTFNESGRLPIANLTEPGLLTLTVKATWTVNGTVYSAYLTITLTVLTPEQTAKYRAESRSVSGDPWRVKYVYAIVASLAMTAIGIDLGYRIKARKIKKVKEL